MSKKLILTTALLSIFFCVFSFGALDLKFITEITISPAAPKAGDTITFSICFKSSGAAAANIKIIGGINGVQRYERTMASIPANDNRTISFTWTAVAGVHTVDFTLDPAHTTGDTNYNNNNIQKEFTVSSYQKIKKFLAPDLKMAYKVKPDLKVSSISWQPLEEPKCSHKFRMFVYVKNIGKGNVTKPFRVTINIQGIVAADEELGSLKPNQETGFYYDWYVINEAYVRIVADYYNVIEESNEENNALFPPINCDK